MTIESLNQERRKYEAHDENLSLQKKELNSVARQILQVAKFQTVLTEEEKEAVEWAKKRLGV